MEYRYIYMQMILNYICRMMSLTWNRDKKLLSVIQSWMITNKLELNRNKTELLVLASSHFSKHSSDFQLQIDNNQISPTAPAKYLGVLYNQHLNMETRVAGIFKESYFHKRNIRHLKSILTRDALIFVVHAFITSRLDYCNSFFSACLINWFKGCNGFETSPFGQSRGVGSMITSLRY